MRCRLISTLVVLAALCGTAGAQETRRLGMNRLVLDRVEAEPSVLHGMIRIRLYITAINLEQMGKVHDLPADAFELTGASSIKAVPYGTGVYDGVDSEIALAIVVQTDGMGADLEELKAAIDDELLAKIEKMPGLQVAVIGYADDVQSSKLTTPAKARAALAALEDPDPATTSDAPDLLRAVDRAVKLLRRARPLAETLPRDAVRKLVVVVSDGRTAEDDPTAVTQLGKRADKLGVRIHAVGYSPPPEPRRRPLFSLGELTALSQGTFRWIQNKVDQSSFRVPFQRVLDELQRQYVLTLFVPEAEPPTRVGVSAKIAGKIVKSRELKIKPAICGALDEPCKPGQYCSIDRCVPRKAKEGIGFFGYLWRIVLVVIGLLAVLIGAGFVITKVREKKDAGPRPIPPPKKPLTGAHAAAPPAAPDAPITGPHLIILSGPRAGQRVGLRHGFQIGKAPGVDLLLEHDNFASGHHAQITMDTAGNCTLVDQHSTNGTYINGVRVTEQRLFDGMSIRCGETELRFLSRM
jgi:hypothetical protein